MASHDSLLTLLRLTESFLSGNGFQKTSTQLHKEAKKRGLHLDNGPQATLPALDSVYTHWQATHSLDQTEGSESDESSVLSSDSEEEEISDESSDSESESEESEDEVIEAVPKEVQGTKGKRVAEVSSSSEDSSADSGSDSASGSSSDSEDAESDSEEVEKPTKVLVTAADSDDSSADSEEEASDSSESDSGSSDSESSDDEEEQEDEEMEGTADTTPRDVQSQSSSTSATLSGEIVPEPLPKRKHIEAEDSTASDSPGAKKVKKTNEPFSRIPKNQFVDPKLASNKFVPYDYAQRAHEKLIVTKGKGFTKEKNKGKRGSYRGGKIDFTPKGIKFED